jgi:hypothetical protein
MICYPVNIYKNTCFIEKYRYYILYIDNNLYNNR